MRHTRRLIAILVSCATWCIAASSVANALTTDDSGRVAVTSSGSAGTPLWQSLTFVALGVLLAVAIVGLGITLNRPRRSEPSSRSQPLPHA
jgi:hypothetical protein